MDIHLDIHYTCIFVRCYFRKCLDSPPWISFYWNHLFFFLFLFSSLFHFWCLISISCLLVCRLFLLSIIVCILNASEILMFEQKLLFRHFFYVCSKHMPTKFSVTSCLFLNWFLPKLKFIDWKIETTNIGNCKLTLFSFSFQLTVFNWIRFGYSRWDARYVRNRIMPWFAQTDRKNWLQRLLRYITLSHLTFMFYKIKQKYWMRVSLNVHFWKMHIFFNTASHHIPHISQSKIIIPMNYCDERCILCFILVFEGNVMFNFAYLSNVTKTNKSKHKNRMCSSSPN